MSYSALRRDEEHAGGGDPASARGVAWRSWSDRVPPARPPTLAVLGAGLVLFLFVALFVARAGDGTEPAPALRGLSQLQRATHNASTHTFVADAPKLCVVGRTYSAQVAYLPLFLLSLWHAGFPDIQVFLLNTDASMPTPELARAAELVNRLVGEPAYATFLDWPLHPAGDYGYGLTDDILAWLYAGPGQHAGCEYLMFSNGDNLYAETFADYLRIAFEKKADLIGWDFVSHHTWHGPDLQFDGKRYTATNGRNVHKSVDFKVASIDLGAAMFRLDFLRQHNLTFLNTGGYGWVSDGQFIEAANARATTTFIQHATLLLHQ